MLLGLTFLKPTPFFDKSFLYFIIQLIFFRLTLYPLNLLLELLTKLFYTHSIMYCLYFWMSSRPWCKNGIRKVWVTWKTHPFRFGIFWQFPLLTSESIKLENLRNFCSIRPNEMIKSLTVHWYLLPFFHYKPFILIASRESGISPRSSIRSLTLCWISFFSPCWGPLIKLTTGASSF